MNASQSNVDQLVSMGFDESQAQQALQRCDGDVNRAIESLLGGGVVASDCTPSFSNPANITMVSSEISQYSVDNGRSACTCIALTTAKTFLNAITNESSIETVVTSDFLHSMVTRGVETYNKLSRQASIEHMSAEVVLQQNIPDLPLTVFGCVRQGILSNSDRQHPMGLYVLLEGVRQEYESANKWMAVLITKTPETVVVCLPPPNRSDYILLDSHPRPQFDGASNAYARIHGSLSDLVTSLEIIFPPTDLGPDVPEMMSMMYNSFDLYPLTLREYGEIQP